jgi:hypothetical protein
MLLPGVDFGWKPHIKLNLVAVVDGIAMEPIHGGIRAENGIT